MNKTMANLRRVLKANGPGHSVEDLHAMGMGNQTRQALEVLLRRGEVTRFGKYWWLKIREPKNYPKPTPPPPAQPLKVALQRAGIQEEKGHIVKRTPRRKAS